MKTIEKHVSSDSLPKKQLPLDFSTELPCDAEWKPMFYTTPLPDSHPAMTKGWQVALFARTFLLNPADPDDEDSQELVPVELTDWQKWLTNNIFEQTPEGRNRYTEVLFMVPRKNGKTFLAALYCMYHLTFAPINSQIYSAAASREQARLVFDMMAGWIAVNPKLEAFLDVKDSRSAIFNKKTRSYFKSLSADGSKNHGLQAYFCVLDEIHAWDDNGSPVAKKRAAELLNSLQKGSIALKGRAQMLMISTAGDYVDESLLGTLYKRGIAESAKQGYRGAYGFFCWQANQSASPLEPETWRSANPMISEGFISQNLIEINLESAAYTSMAKFLRDHLNIWAASQGEPYIQPYIWDNAKYVPGPDDYDDPFYKGCEVVVGFDAAKRGDAVAITIMTLGEEDVPPVLKIWELWERPENPPEGWHISRSEVEESLIRLHEEFEVKAIWADKFYYEAALVEWEQEHGWEIELVPQSKERKDRYAKEFRVDLVEGTIFHLDDPDLNRHVKNTTLDRNESFSKPPGAKRQKIDAFVASMLCNAGRNFIVNQPEPEPQTVMRFR